MPLDPQARAFLEPLNAAEPVDVWTLSAEQSRALFTELGGAAEGAPAVQCTEHQIDGPEGPIGLRLYRPPGTGPFPMLAYFHGGGFVLGLNSGHDWIARWFAHETGCLVGLVDYRLAPESPFPAAPEDCFRAVQWMNEKASNIGGLAETLSVAGDSAGGNLAAVVALMARERGGPHLAHQMLLYPVTDHAFDTPSYEENSEGYLLTREFMRWFWNHYLPEPQSGDNPYASPLRAENLTRLPPATIITAEYDPLRDEGEAYARRLIAAGVTTQLTRYSGMIHGFFTMPNLFEQTNAALEQCAEALRGAWA
ncbi:alpha/beta hydrolase [Myxococcota bacterium]|nr:alpha/beta hydrolase [Myxococcota bacterium]